MTWRPIPTATDPNGVAIPNLKFKWEMLRPQAGTVSSDGRWTASGNIGAFTDAIQVTLIPRERGADETVTTSLSVQIVDPASLAQRISATVLPQVISLKPEEDMTFTTVVLDTRGRQIDPTDTHWEVLDPRAGVLSPDGHFMAGKAPGVYPDAIRVSMALPGADERVEATGTVIIVDASPQVAGLELRPRVAIFPERVVLSPGESARFSIIGLGGQVQALSTANVRWSVSPPEVGEVSRFVTVTAHDFPGIYENAIRAEVTLETEDGPLLQEVTATLVIRDKLSTVEIRPEAATLAPDEQVPFRAIAYDKNRVLLPDIIFRWTVPDSDIGKIDSSGLFTATGQPGEYPGAVQGAVQVEAVQREPTSSE